MPLFKFYIFIIVCILSINIVSSVFAQSFETNSGLGQTGRNAGYAESNPTIGQQKTIADRIGQVIGILLSFIGVIFLGLMMYGGYTWMMARGNQAEVDKAKKMIESAIIGLVIVLAAYAITYFVGLAFTSSTSV